jgi:hypothetical protein
MSAADPVQLTLAIDRASDPITGALRDGSGNSVEFSGWLGFAAALEQLLGAPRRSARPEPVGEVSPKTP